MFTAAGLRCWFLAVLACTGHGAMPVYAFPPAEPASPYVEIPFPGNLEEALLRQLLQKPGDKDDLQKLLADSLQRAKIFGLDPDRLMKMVQDPREVQKIQDLIKNGSKLDNKTWQNAWKEILDKAKGVTPLQPPLGEPEPIFPPDLKPSAPDVGGADERMEAWVREMADWLDERGWGDMLRDSPALQKTLRDLDMSWLNRDRARDWGQFMPDFKRLKGVPWPSLRLPALRLGRPNLGGWDASIPKVGDVPGVADIGPLQIFGWLFVIVAACLLLFTWLARGQSLSQRATAGRRGWPVDPAQIATRAELVQAFDYLALTALGSQARPWNHLQIAEQWTGAAEQAGAVQRLCELYEQARYTPGEGDLPPGERDQARRDLIFLARMKCV